MGLRKLELERVDQINMAQRKNRWRVIMNTVMNIRIP